MPDMTLIVLLILTATGNPIGLSWDAPTTNIDGSPIVEPLTYNVYRSRNGSPYRLTKHAGISATKASITENVVSGELNCFEIAAIESGISSSLTLPVCITVP
jgi:hypothetical protein